MGAQHMPQVLPKALAARKSTGLGRLRPLCANGRFAVSVSGSTRTDFIKPATRLTVSFDVAEFTVLNRLTKGPLWNTKIKFRSHVDSATPRSTYQQRASAKANNSDPTALSI